MVEKYIFGLKSTEKLAQMKHEVIQSGLRRVQHERNERKDSQITLKNIKYLTQVIGDVNASVQTKAPRHSAE